MTVRVALHDVALQFRFPLTTADGWYRGRRSVLVAVEDEGTVGWGEAAAFPSGRWGTIDEAWEALTAWNPAGPHPAMPLAAAATQAALADLAARRAGLPLCRHLGGDLRPIRARLTTGLLATPDDLVERLDTLVASGATAVKIKIGPGHDTDHLRAARQAFPDLDLSVDANGAYTDPADPVFAALDAAGVGLVEQPFPPGNLTAAAALRPRLSAAVCIDEDLRSPDDARRVLAAGAADVLALKTMRLGLAASSTILAMCRDAGAGVKAGGTFDTVVGRHHVLAFATLPGVVDAEAGPPASYLDDPLGEYPGFVAGTVTPVDAPGIGPGPDAERLRQATVRRAP